MNVKFKRQDTIVADMRVRIYDKEKCIYEREIVRSDGKNDLEILMQNLRDVQSDVNDFLTTLIQRQDPSVDAANRLIPSDTESDCIEDETEEEEKEDETRTNSKKCKLST